MFGIELQEKKNEQQNKSFKICEHINCFFTTLHNRQRKGENQETEDSF